MDLSSYTPKRRLEFVAVALDRVLQDLSAPTPTREVVDKVCAILSTRENVLVARILSRIAPKIPEAQRGETFQHYGQTMQRWEWWPKGSTPEGPTRQAVREGVTTHPLALDSTATSHILGCPECLAQLKGLQTLIGLTSGSVPATGSL